MSEKDEQTEILRNLLKWIKIIGIKEVKPIIETQIQTEIKKRAYQLSDGSRGTPEIAKTIGNLSHQTIANYWREWERAGLGDSISVAGGKRFKKSFDLEDFGIKIVDNKQNIENIKEEVKQDV